MLTKTPPLLFSTYRGFFGFQEKQSPSAPGQIDSSYVTFVLVNTFTKQVHKNIVSPASTSSILQGMLGVNCFPKLQDYMAKGNPPSCCNRPRGNSYGLHQNTVIGLRGSPYFILSFTNQKFQSTRRKDSTIIQATNRGYGTLALVRSSWKVERHYRRTKSAYLQIK